MDEMMPFGLWTKGRSNALDLTQDALAHHVDCSPELIRRIEADARRPSRQVAERLAGSLGLPPEECAAFVQAARAELAADRIEPPTQSVVSVRL